MPVCSVSGLEAGKGNGQGGRGYLEMVGKHFCGRIKTLFVHRQKYTFIF